MLALFAAPVVGQTCEDRVADFADAHGLSAELPLTVAPAEPLQESGGVIAPPPTGDEAVIEPPETAETMPTAPDIEPEDAPPEGDAATPDAALRAQVEALLSAARTAARQGDEEGCLDRLAEADGLME